MTERTAMNAFNLLLPDFTPSKVWVCGECRLTCSSETAAHQCCTPIPCGFCKKPTEKKFRHGHETATHDVCDVVDQSVREADRMDRAEKLEDWDGWVYEWDGGGSRNGHFESLEA